jgi:predicted nucleic acid-binding Zn ribbon protein
MSDQPEQSSNEISAVFDIEPDPYDPFDQPVGTPLAEAMNRFMRHLKSAPVDTLTGLRTSWEEIVGPRMAAVSRPVSLIGEVLLISCDDSTWAAQLKWMEQSICGSVRNQFPGVQIKGIRVRQRHR